MASLDASPTPNPNSLKFTRKGGSFIESGMESFSNAEEAVGHPLGESLFAIDGVVNVFILPQFLTVTKSEQGRWDDIVPAVERVVERELDA